MEETLQLFLSKRVNLADAEKFLRRPVNRTCFFLEEKDLYYDEVKDNIGQKTFTVNVNGHEVKKKISFCAASAQQSTNQHFSSGYCQLTYQHDKIRKHKVVEVFTATQELKRQESEQELFFDPVSLAAHFRLQKSSLLFRAINIVSTVFNREDKLMIAANNDIKRPLLFLFPDSTLAPLFILLSHCEKAKRRLTIIDSKCYQWITQGVASEKAVQHKLRLHTNEGYQYQIISPRRIDDIITQSILKPTEISANLRPNKSEFFYRALNRHWVDRTIMSNSYDSIVNGEHMKQFEKYLKNNAHAIKNMMTKPAKKIAPLKYSNMLIVKTNKSSIMMKNLLKVDNEKDQPEESFLLVPRYVHEIGKDDDIDALSRSFVDPIELLSMRVPRKNMPYDEMISVRFNTAVSDFDRMLKLMTKVNRVCEFYQDDERVFISMQDAGVFLDFIVAINIDQKKEGNHIRSTMRKLLEQNNLKQVIDQLKNHAPDEINAFLQQRVKKAIEQNPPGQSPTKTTLAYIRKSGKNCQRNRPNRISDLGRALRISTIRKMFLTAIDDLLLAL